MQRTAALLLFVLLAEGAAPQLVINEVGIAPTGGNGSQFTELFNRSGCTIDLNCYTLAFSSTSGTGNATGWTVKIPSGKTIAPGGYFLIGGTAGSAGVSGGTGYPTGGTPNSFTSTADVDVGTTQMTANAVYIKQFLAAGSFPNTKGQLSLLDAAGNLVASVSYNNGNNAGSYPLSAYTTCNASGNVQGLNNVSDPGASAANVNAAFAAAAVQGIYLSSGGMYLAETSLTPRASNGGTQLCSGPLLNSVNNVTACFRAGLQSITLPYSAANAPTAYSLTWSAAASGYFAAVSNATLSGIISVVVPANTPAGVYTGFLTLLNACGNSCPEPFTITIHALPVVNAGTYAPVCVNGVPVTLTGTPGGGTFTGTGVSGNGFAPPAAGAYTVTYSYTDAVTGCASNASALLYVSAPASSYTTACTSSTPFLFYGQPLTASGLHAVPVNNANGCTDTARIYLTVKETTAVDTAACDSVIYNGTVYYNDTALTQTISSAVTGCDSLVKIIRIGVNKRSAKDTTVCLPANGALTLLGQTFSAGGNYTLHTFNAAGCDSTVRLHLTVTQIKTQTVGGCDSVVFDGRTYFASAVVRDTVRSIASGCDSSITVTAVTVRKKTHHYASLCLKQGQTYTFNGQVLSATGSYQTAYSTAYCDSIVHLYLVVSEVQNQAVSGCDTVIYNGIAYTASTVLADTVKSTVTQCDSLVQLLTITVSKRPAINVSRDTLICLWGTAVLQASSPGGVVRWMGFGNANPVSVSPQTKTQYTAVAVDTNGCVNSLAVTVDVQRLSIQVFADKNPVLSGTSVSLQTKGNLFYSTVSWQPASLFPNQAGSGQRLTIDTSINITVMAQTPVGCRDTARLQLAAVPLGDVYIPSGFTPNGDGRNDEVRVTGTAIKELEFKIFNRWGQPVFSTTDRGKGWDGKLAGVLQPAGTYVYVARVKNVSGQVVEKKGTVTLIR